MNVFRHLAGLFTKHRRRFAKAAILLAVLGGTYELARVVPRETTIRYRLGPDHDLVHEARIGYVLRGEEVKGVRFQYATGAPEAVFHTVDLSPGKYAIVADVRGDGVARVVRRSIEVPSDGIVRVDLFDQALAGWWK